MPMIILISSARPSLSHSERATLPASKNIVCNVSEAALNALVGATARGEDWLGVMTLEAVYIFKGVKEMLEQKWDGLWVRDCNPYGELISRGLWKCTDGKVEEVPW